MKLSPGCPTVRIAQTASASPNTLATPVVVIALTIVVFLHGMQNRPSVQYMRNTRRVLPSAYADRLKQLVLVGSNLMLRVLLMATAAVAVTFGWFTWRLGQGLPIDLVRTETFTVLAMCQWFNVLNCQSATRSALRLGLLKNPWLLGGLAVSVALQVAVIYLPPMNTLFHTVPLPPATLIALLALTSLVLWAEELRKWVLRLRRKPD